MVIWNFESRLGLATKCHAVCSSLQSLRGCSIFSNRGFGHYCQFDTTSQRKPVVYSQLSSLNQSLSVGCSLSTCKHHFLLSWLCNHPEPCVWLPLQGETSPPPALDALCVWMGRLQGAFHQPMLCSGSPEAGPCQWCILRLMACGLLGNKRAGNGGQPSEIGRKQTSFWAKPLRRTWIKQKESQRLWKYDCVLIYISQIKEIERDG